MSANTAKSDPASSRTVGECQICGHKNLEHVLFLGFLPPVNQMIPIGVQPYEQSGYPAQLLRCPECRLVQLGLVVDPAILFPPEYPYTSSTTKILRDNFAELYRECGSLIDLREEDLVVDIGSNDGNLLSNFAGRHRVLGITPEEIGKIAIQRGIPTLLEYFGPEVAAKVRSEHGPAKVVTATNVFAHIDDVNGVLESILSMLAPDGVFISESHYLLPLIQTLQYDTVYHEHLRYYSLASLSHLLQRHGLEAFHAKRIPTHGGSIRVYAARKGVRESAMSVRELLLEEDREIGGEGKLAEFRGKVVLSKLALQAKLYEIKRQGGRVFGIGAPSRASTLINYVGIDDGILDCVLEIPGSHKIGNYMPGTLIPIEEETRLYVDQPEFALMLSWHIADELIPKIRAKGFRGRFLVPLPEPRIV